MIVDPLEHDNFRLGSSFPDPGTDLSAANVTCSLTCRSCWLPRNKRAKLGRRGSGNQYRLAARVDGGAPHLVLETMRGGSVVDLDRRWPVTGDKAQTVMSNDRLSPLG